MAFTHIYVDQTKQYGQMLRSAMTQFENGRNSILQVIDVMITMIDGDTATEANYTEVTTRFGFINNTASKAAFDELNSLKSKINTDADVTNVFTAINQAISKFR
jgi:hypothetical protein